MFIYCSEAHTHTPDCSFIGLTDWSFVARSLVHAARTAEVQTRMLRGKCTLLSSVNALNAAARPPMKFVFIIRK